MSEGNGGKYAPRPGSIPGVPINLGGVTLVMAPLGLRLAREFDDRAKQCATDDDRVALGIDMILASAQRNYPDITRDELEALLDAGNMREAGDAIAGLSGLKRVTPGEPAPRGQ